MMPVRYWTGMLQPAKSTIFPPWPACQSLSTVLRSGSLMRHPFGMACRPRTVLTGSSRNSPGSAVRRGFVRQRGVDPYRSATSTSGTFPSDAECASRSSTSCSLALDASKHSAADFQTPVEHRTAGCENLTEFHELPGTGLVLASTLLRRRSARISVSHRGDRRAPEFLPPRRDCRRVATPEKLVKIAIEP